MKGRKLSDVELALRLLASVMATELAYNHERIFGDLGGEPFKKYNPLPGWNEHKPNNGDVVIALTSGYRKCNEFTIAIVDGVIDGGLRVKDIKTGRLCNFFCEEFLCIPKESLGYRWKFGLEREVYEELERTWDNYAFLSYKFSIDGNHLRWSVRRRFSNEECVVVEFEIEEGSSVKSIVDKSISTMNKELEAIKQIQS